MDYMKTIVDKLIRRGPAVLFLIVGFVGCSPSQNRHEDIKVKAANKWERGRAKHCMLFNGRPSVIGGKVEPDPKEMLCQLNETSEMSYSRISNLTLDDASEKLFHDPEHYGVPMLCQETSETELKCVLDSNPTP